MVAWKRRQHAPGSYPPVPRAHWAVDCQALRLRTTQAGVAFQICGVDPCLPAALLRANHDWLLPATAWHPH
jgi:hypothetical protein